MGRKRRPSAKDKALGNLKPGQVVIFKERKRTRKSAKGGRETVGFSTQLVAQSQWSVIIDSRTLTRMLQIELATWYRAALENQVNPETGARLPKPRKSVRSKRRKSNTKLGIETGQMLEQWQLGKVTGAIKKSRAIVQPYSEGAGGSAEYGRKFFLKYMLGSRSYPPPMIQGRDPKTGKFTQRREGNPSRYPHAPVDFQGVKGLAAAVIQDTVDAFINDSGLMSSGPLTPPQKDLGAGNLRQIKAASGISGSKKPKPI
jgi:hypothetical protein